jgi:hypothetical protein
MPQKKKRLSSTISFVIALSSYEVHQNDAAPAPQQLFKSLTL